MPLHPISTLLLASTISQLERVSVCFQDSQSGSVTLCRFSSWLLPPAVPLSLCVFYPAFQLPSHSSSHLLLFSFSSFFSSLVSSCAELPTVSLSCYLPPPSHLVLSRLTTSCLLPTPLLLTGRGGGRIRRKLNSSAVRR